MPKNTVKIICANCYKKQIDRGRNQTCEKCGMSPLPSYAYPTSNAFHPSRCNAQQTVLPVRQRKTQVDNPAI